MSRHLLLVAALIGLTSLSAAQAQPDPNAGGQTPPPAQGQPGQPGDGRQGDRGNRGNFSPEEFRARMMERFKEELKSPDDEWQVLKPKLEKVMTAQAEARFGGFGGRGGFGGPGGPGGGRGGRGGDNANPNQPPENESEFAAASRELRTVLANESASVDEIVNRLKTFREARAKADEKLKEAQKELQAVVTERQEAVLVMRGMLQ